MALLIFMGSSSEDSTKYVHRSQNVCKHDYFSGARQCNTILRNLRRY
uniref:Uncharacterized protein n=1 Tax=Picea glauca TaxID=3330 RepID=A0A124GNL4_PICGL|nr:hypothetical protein ABT39_MTgene3740 [Picea glauca]